MGKKNPKVSAYIAAAAPFARPILTRLRSLVHAACPTVEESIKWGMPSFGHHGILCQMAAFKRHCAFGFWKSRLVIEPPAGTARSAMGQLGRLTRIEELPPAAELKRLIRKAVALNESGATTPRRARTERRPPPRSPAYLTRALAANPAARKTFAALPPSGRREYIEWLTGAKQESTRAKRLLTAIAWLNAGKRYNWRYGA
jgi:hypothetical protein